MSLPGENSIKSLNGELNAKEKQFYKNQLFKDMRVFYQDRLPAKDGKIPNRPQSIWMPHIPFISSCDGLGANINLYTLMDL